MCEHWALPRRSFSSDPKIRPYLSDDFEEVVALWNLVFPDDPPWNKPEKVIETKMTMQADSFFVAIRSEHVAGTVLAGFDGTRGWIHHLAVHPDFRRQGIATQLVRRAENHLAEVGCPKLNLQVRAGNESAIGFYKSLGFDSEDRVSFGKHLAKP